MFSAVATLPHPQWLYKDLVADTLPWHQSHPYTYAQFIEKYTLHGYQLKPGQPLRIGVSVFVL
jgi:hypothetical protein